MRKTELGTRTNCAFSGRRCARAGGARRNHKPNTSAAVCVRKISCAAHAARTHNDKASNASRYLFITKRTSHQCTHACTHACTRTHAHAQAPASVRPRRPGDERDARGQCGGAGARESRMVLLLLPVPVLRCYARTPLTLNRIRPRELRGNFKIYIIHHTENRRGRCRRRLRCRCGCVNTNNARALACAEIPPSPHTQTNTHTHTCGRYFVAPARLARARTELSC